MKTQPLHRALNALAHPISIGASVILLLNALVWQKSWPSWWTGKIGDFAWLMIVPFLAAVLLTLCLPNIFTDSGLTGKCAIVITGLGFGLVKTVPSLNALVVALAGQVGFTPKLLPDPSDLIALPFLLVAWRVWNSTRSVSSPTPIRLGALALAALAVIADSPAPVQHGVVCLTTREDGLYGFSQEESLTSYLGEGPRKYWTGVYTSADGGATWQHRAFTTKEEFNQKVDCSQVSWPLEVGPTSGAETQLFLVEGQGIYASDDDGQTLHLEQKVPEVYSALLDAPSGNLVIAAGVNGLYVRTPAGGWVEVTQPGK